MKKIYTTPQLITVMLAQKKPMMVTTSIGISETNYDGKKTIEVKEESHRSYNVWDDDWSE